MLYYTKRSWELQNEPSCHRLIFFLLSLFDVSSWRVEFFILPLFENYGSCEILSRYLIFILYGIETLCSHLPKNPYLNRIDRYFTTHRWDISREKILLPEKPFYRCKDSCSMERFENVFVFKGMQFSRRE